MQGCIRRVVLATVLAMCAVRASGSDQLPERIDLAVGETRVLAVDAVRVAVGNGRVLGLARTGRAQLLLVGQAGGSTDLRVWPRDGAERRIAVTVSEVDLDAAVTAVGALLADVAEVRTRVAGGRIVLEGEPASGTARDRISAVAGLYPGLVLDLTGKQPWDRMIHFEVRIVEFRSSRLRDLGIRWNPEINGPTAGLLADFSTNDVFRIAPPQGGAAPELVEARPPGRAWPPKVYFGLATSIESRIRLLEQTGDAEILAEPTLSCRSGGSARFVAGGELPMPVVDGLGSTDIQFKEYGVILDVKPIADPSGAILARVDTEVSQIDESQRVLGVPGFLKRRSATDVSLREGETLVIAGLVNRTRSGSVQRVPGAGSVPVVGGLFRSRVRREERTELAIFITPRIVAARAEAPGTPPRDPNAEALRRFPPDPGASPTPPGTSGARGTPVPADPTEAVGGEVRRP